MIPLIQFGRLREAQERESRGQKECLQATLATMHLKKKMVERIYFNLANRTKGV
jgi:hypothetical protein